MHRPNILVTNHLSPSVLDFLNTKARVDVRLDLNEVDFVKQADRYDAIICRSATRVRSCVLGTGRKGRLKIVATATSGFDHINILRANELNIPVVHSPEGNTVSNAEYIIGAMISISRHFIDADRLMRQGVWDQECVLGSDLRGKTFATVGFGRIGSLAATYAKMLGMNVIAYDPYVSAERFAQAGVASVDLEQLLREGDFISFSVPLSQETLGLVSHRELSLLKQTAYIIQGSRGGIIDEDALIWSLKNRTFAGAVIDVFENEPSPRKDFFELPNVLLTPHYACSTQESRTRSGMSVARDVLSYLRSGTVINLAPGSSLL